MDSFVTPVPLSLSRELFHQTYLTPSHYPDKDLIEGAIAALVVLDFCIGLLRIPYLMVEVQRIQKMVEEGKTLTNSTELCYQTVSTLSNTLEIFIWFSEKKWLDVSKHRVRMAKKMSTFARIILYEQAVRKETVAFMRAYRLTKSRPEIAKRVEYKHLKVSLISHTAFLGWSTLQFITQVKGIPYPRPFQKLLHVTSVVFGLIAMGYDKESEVNQFFRRLAKKLPTGDIYR